MVLYLKLATVKLQQLPVREEELLSDNGSPQAAAALPPLLLQHLGLPCGLKDDRLVGVGTPGSGRGGSGLGDDKHELPEKSVQGGCSLMGCLDSRC